MGRLHVPTPIDLSIETLIPFPDVPDNLPKTNGKKLNICTLYRWKNQGLDGVRLAVCFVAGKLHTSKEALLRFDQAVTNARLNPPASPTKNKSTKPAKKAHEKALRSLGAAQTKTAPAEPSSASPNEGGR